jgi:hypothetical protein
MLLARSPTYKNPEKYEIFVDRESGDSYKWRLSGIKWD